MVDRLDVVAIRSRNSPIVRSPHVCRAIARSGQSTWSMNPALWIRSYSAFIASASAKRYSSWLR